MTACNIACERAPAPFVSATKGERSKVAGHSEKRGGGGGEGGSHKERRGQRRGSKSEGEEQCWIKERCLVDATEVK